MLISHESSELTIIPPATLKNLHHKDFSSTVLHSVYSFEDGTEIEVYQDSKSYRIIESNREYNIENHVLRFI